MSLLLAKPKAELLRSKVLQIAKRKDVSPKAGEKEYGDVKFADPTNKKYPLDSEKHVRAAWSYINMPKNAKKYSSGDLKTIKGRIRAAAKKLGIKISESEKQSLAHDTLLPLVGEDCYTVLNRQWYCATYPGKMDGSIEEHLEKVHHEFREWSRKEDDFKYRWAQILGVFSDGIVFYCEDYGSEIEYYKVGYATSLDGEVSIEGDVERVDVKLVIEQLSMEDDDSDEDEEAEMGDHPMPGTDEEQSMDKNKVAKQDEVADETAISGTAAAATPPQIGVTPKANAKTTDASTPGASVPDASAEAEGTKEPGLSDEEGVGKAAADGSSDAEVTAELGKEAPGYKGEPAGTDGTPTPYKGQDDPRPVVQGIPYDLADVSMSYIQSVKTAESSDGKKTMKIQGIATRGDIVNKAGQVYPSTVWEKNLPRMNELAQQGKFLGKLEHPDEEQGLVDTAIKWDKFWLQGADVWFEATVVPTEPYGKNLQALLEAGVQVDMSSRGYGTFKNQDWRGVERPVMQDDFICTAIDAVWRGASTGSGVKSVEYQSDPNPTQGAEETVDKTKETTQSDVQAKAAEIRAITELKQTRGALVDQAQLSDLGLKAYKQALEGCETLEALITTSETLLPHLQSVFPLESAKEVVQSDTYQPTFFVKQTDEERAPKTVGELFDRLVQDLPDHYPGQEGLQNSKIPNHFRSPKEACKRLMINIAREQAGSFNGRDAALGLLALEQGKIERAQDILTQSLADGSTVIGDGSATYPGTGAPLSNYLIFPLIRRVYPMYIMNEICSIQPMDRPEGKLFFLDHWRANESPSELRVDLNTSANPFNSSYADNATEGAAANLIRLRLSSVLVSAHTKKLGAAWSIEEMQDLRAYHGLDAAQELLGGIAREMALEWNKEVLDDMLAQASAAALTFGTTKPSSGFDNQKDWDEYLWVYLQKLDNAIFSKRNGPMTHIVAGVDAALAMAKSMRGVFTFSGAEGVDAAVMEQFPGTTFFGNIATPNGSKYRVLKTNFWGTGTTNGSKILGIRKGTEWSDTPYIWAPYTDYVTPMLTDPADFSQKQGIVSRAAKKVVVSDAMGYIDVDSSTGVVL
jgi:hypothetical protein